MLLGLLRSPASLQGVSPSMVPARGKRVQLA